MIDNADNYVDTLKLEANQSQLRKYLSTGNQYRLKKIFVDYGIYYRY